MCPYRSALERPIFVTAYPRYGYGLLHEMLKAKGVVVNDADGPVH